MSNENEVQIISTVRKCWVRNRIDQEWKPLWHLEGAGSHIAIEHVFHDRVPLASEMGSRHLTTCGFIVFDDPNIFIDDPDLPHKKDLVGTLCGTSNISIKDAQMFAEGLTNLSVITGYDESKAYPYKTPDCVVNFAYPVTTKTLKRMLEILQENS